jgi:hypothetical protein
LREIQYLKNSYFPYERKRVREILGHEIFSVQHFLMRQRGGGRQKGKGVEGRRERDTVDEEERV